MLQVEEAVCVQRGTGPEPTSEDHQETGEDAEEPNIHEEMEEDEPCQQRSEAQQTALPEQLG